MTRGHFTRPYNAPTHGRQEEDRRQAEASLGRQPSDPESRRRRSCAGLRQGHAGLETRRRATPRHARRAHRARRPQGRAVELPLLWHRGPGLVPQLSLLHEVHQGDLPQLAGRCVLSRPSTPSRRTCATFTSTKTTGSTTSSWRVGSGRHRSYPGKSCSDRAAFSGSQTGSQAFTCGNGPGTGSGARERAVVAPFHPCRPALHRRHEPRVWHESRPRSPDPAARSSDRRRRHRRDLRCRQAGPQRGNRRGQSAAARAVRADLGRGLRAPSAAPQRPGPLRGHRHGLGPGTAHADPRPRRVVVRRVRLPGRDLASARTS